MEYLNDIISLAQVVAGYLPDWLVIAILSPIAVMYILWIFYLAIMNLKSAKDAGTMTKVAYSLALPMLVAGYILDIVVNVTIGTLLFLDFPHYKRLTLSARMSYLYEPGSTAWRSKLSEWFARNLLNNYDPSGQHID
jgi:hypothetical protein